MAEFFLFCQPATQPAGMAAKEKIRHELNWNIEGKVLDNTKHIRKQFVRYNSELYWASINNIEEYLTYQKFQKRNLIHLMHL